MIQGEENYSFEILNDGVVESNISIEPCKIRNEFHKSDGGCYIRVYNNQRFHVYNKMPVTVSSEWETVNNILGLRWSYVIMPYASGGFRVMTRFPVDSDSLDDFAHDGADSFRSIIQLLIVDYHNNIRPLLIDRCGRQFDLKVRYIFDVARSNNTLYRMRPLTISDDVREYYAQHRRSFFELLKMYAATTRPMDFLDVNLREKKTCSVETFYSKIRNIPFEFKCEYQTERACAHIQESSINGTTLYEIPKRLCSFLLRKMVEDHTEERINALFGFKCHYVDSGDGSNSTPLAIVHTKLFSRVDKMHRMCIPDMFIGDAWFSWYIHSVVMIGDKIVV